LFKCVLYYRHRVSTQLQLTNISISIDKIVPLYRVALIACIRILCYLQFVRYLTSRFRVAATFAFPDLQTMSQSVTLGYVCDATIRQLPHNRRHQLPPTNQTVTRAAFLAPRAFYRSAVRQCRPNHTFARPPCSYH